MAKPHNAHVRVATEGYNGHARPFDRSIKYRFWYLHNFDNLKSACFNEIFPAAAKCDSIDSRKAMELFQLRDHLPMADDILQPVTSVSGVNQALKGLTRRRRRLIQERVRVSNAMQSDLRAIAPGIAKITGNATNLWFMQLLTCRANFKIFARIRSSNLLKLPGAGPIYATAIQTCEANFLLANNIK